MEYEYRDILEEPLSLEEIDNLASLADMETRDLVNVKSPGFKKMDIDPEEVTSQRARELIRENPRVMYRPVLTDGTEIVVGFKPEEMAKII